jgi:glutamate N-acetyltransferase/amino-acid N-acetyltransferase
MEDTVEFIPGGGVTSPKGFRAGAAIARIKEQAEPRLDLGIIHSEVPCTAAAVFTANKVKAAPIILSQERLQGGWVAAVVVNSGCANACTGDEGLADAAEMAELAAKHIGAPPGEVLVASTGVIGQRLPMARVRDGINRVVLESDGGRDFARAIMTTDTMLKEVAVRAGDFIIGGVAKGSGMIHPNMATLLCFLTTDAAVGLDFLKSALRGAADASFNMVSIDGDTSTNDMLLIMANGLAGGRPIRGGGRGKLFQQVLHRVCIHLAKAIARDGEGATKLLEATVSGAASLADARLAARAIVGSPLVKTAVHGCDPNWGRMVAAAGRSGAALVLERVDLTINGISLLEGGRPLPFDREAVMRSLGGSDITIALNLNLGRASATAWGCDLSEGYVRINSHYMT